MVSAFRFLPSALCLLPSAFCLLLCAFCFLPSAFCVTAFCLLPSAFCFLPSALLLRCCINRPGLDHVFLIVKLSVTIYIHANFKFVLFAVVHVAGIEPKTVLTAKQGVK